MNENDKKTDDQAEKGAASAAPARPKGCLYYLFEKKKQGISLRGADGQLITRHSEDNILVLDPGSDEDWLVAQYLSQPRKLEEYGAKRIKSLSSAAGKLSLGERLDELLVLSPAQLSALVPKGRGQPVKTRGDMIAAIIEKDL